MFWPVACAVLNSLFDCLKARFIEPLSFGFRFAIRAKRECRNYFVALLSDLHGSELYRSGFRLTRTRLLLVCTFLRLSSFSRFSCSLRLHVFLNFVFAFVFF